MRKLAFYAVLTSLLVSTATYGQNDKPGKAEQRRGPGRGNPEKMFGFLDKNKDGKIDQDEAPEMMKNRFAQLDQNKDGAIDAEEIKQVMAQRGQFGGKNPPRNFRPGGEPGDPAAKGRFGAGGQGMILEKLFQEGDTDGDGNLNPAEQKAIIAKFSEMMSRFRPMPGGPGGQQKQKLGERYGRQNTDPVQPKRPGK